MQKATSEVKDISLATKRNTKQMLKESEANRQQQRMKELFDNSKKDQKITALRMEN